jgi:hypothetical protein
MGKIAVGQIKKNQRVGGKQRQFKSDCSRLPDPFGKILPISGLPGAIMFNLNQWLESQPGPLRLPLTCMDGAELSIQASFMHYCSPREDEGPYKSVEVGFPEGLSKEDLASLAEFHTGCEMPVYSWVPVNLIEKIVENHGGPIF